MIKVPYLLCQSMKLFLLLFIYFISLKTKGKNLSLTCTNSLSISPYLCVCAYSCSTYGEATEPLLDTAAGKASTLTTLTEGDQTTSKEGEEAMEHLLFYVTVQHCWCHFLNFILYSDSLLLSFFNYASVSDNVSALSTSPTKGDQSTSKEDAGTTLNECPDLCIPLVASTHADEETTEPLESLETKIDDNEPPPPEDQEPMPKTSTTPDNIMDDAPLLGREIRIATCKLPSSRSGDSNSQKMTAIVFRDYNKANNLSTNVLRFVASKTDVDEEEYFAKTMCLRKMTIPQHTRKDTILFFPFDKKPEATVIMENFIREKAIPITCWQRSLEWFVGRMYIITGTAGQWLALKDSNSRKLLLKNPEMGWDEETHRLSQARVAEYLREQWVFKRGMSTPEMKSGSMNEQNVLKTIAKQSYCKQVYDTGLLISRKNRCIGVSPDGIIKVMYMYILYSLSVCLKLVFLLIIFTYSICHYSVSPLVALRKVKLELKNVAQQRRSLFLWKSRQGFQLK